MDLCLRVGEVLLSSGRRRGGRDGHDAVGRLRTSACGNPEIDVTFTSLSMSYQASPEEPPVLQIRHVKQRDIDYEDLTLVDHLVRDVLAGRAST